MLQCETSSMSWIHSGGLEWFGLPLSYVMSGYYYWMEIFVGIAWPRIEHLICFLFNKTLYWCFIPSTLHELQQTSKVDESLYLGLHAEAYWNLSSLDGWFQLEVSIISWFGPKPIGLTVFLISEALLKWYKPRTGGC